MESISLILVSLTLTSAMLSIIFFTAWASFERMPHTLTWGFAFVTATVQWTVNLNQDLFPNHQSYWLVVNALSLTVVTLAWYGHAQRLQRRVKTWMVWGMPLPWLFAIGIFTLIYPHVGMSMALTPWFGSVMLAIVAAWIVTDARKPSAADIGMVVTTVIFCVSQMVAGVAAVMQGSQGDPAFLAVYQKVNFLTLPTAYTGMGMFTVFMLATDLSGRMKEIAMLDQLTGLLNRRGFGDCAAKVYASARRTGRSVSVVMTDIDKFKSINDKFGHMVGDLAIQHFAKILADKRRTEDVLARVGGEEFALVLPGTEVPQAISIANTLCRQLRSSPMDTENGPLSMTASFGVATLAEEDTCLSDVIARADTALYQSKNKGRDQVDLLASQVMLCADGLLRPVNTRF